MKIKFLKSVLILLAVLNVQISWAQPNCVPAGNNSTGTQLTYNEIGEDFNFTITNNSRHNIINETLVLDQQDSDMQFVFDNPNGATIYIGMYLDLNEDGDFDYLTENVFEGQTNGTHYSEVLTLTQAVLDQLALGPKFLRMIVTTNYDAIENTCFFPDEKDPYQANDIRTGRIKIKTTTAQIQTGTGTGVPCQNAGDSFDTGIRITNEYEVDAYITSVTIWFGREYTVCDGNYIVGSTLPNGTLYPPYAGGGGVPGNAAYTWIPSGGSYQLLPAFFVDLETVVANACWTPIEELDLKVTVYYDLNGGLSTARQSYKEFDFPDVNICEGEDTVGGGGGGFTNGGSTPVDLQPTITPNPSSGNTQVNFELTKEADVQVEVYNLLGETMLIEKANGYTPGQHNLTLATENLPVGTYLVNMRINGASSMLTKMIIAR